MRPFCPECDLREQMSRITRRSLLEEVRRLGIEAGEDEFARRLSVCDGCFQLEAGMLCRMSGAYVAYRARVLSADGCPRGKWEP